MGKIGKLTPQQWGPFMPAQNSAIQKGPWYYRDTECVVIEYSTDEEAALALLPSDLELYEPATGFLVIERNHWTSFGPYAEVYSGILCSYDGDLYAYVPGVYVTGENSQLAGREVWGFGKKRAERIEVTTHDNGQIRAELDVREHDAAIRLTIQTGGNLPAEAMSAMPLICLRIVPDVEGGEIPALAQLTVASFVANPIKGTDGRDEVYDARVLSFKYGTAHDCDVPVLDVLGAKYAHFNADLPYGKVLKTYTEAELRGAATSKNGARRGGKETAKIG